MGLIESFKQGYSGESDARGYEVGGVVVTCTHCGGRVFEERTALLNTAELTLLGLDWANREAYLLVCDRCAHVEWFLQAPRPI